MNFMHAKLPLAPQDWTVKRGGKYLIKLALFIIVPGLHQMACKRWILGGLLMTIYFAAVFTNTNLPYDFSKDVYPAHNIAELLFKASRYMCWILIALDWNNLKSRELKTNLFLALVCAAGLYFIFPHSGKNLNVIVEYKNDLCPAICRYDVIEYDLIDYKTDKVLAGDLVLMDLHSPNPYLSRILETPSGALCKENKKSPKYLPVDKLNCLKDNPESNSTKYYYPYLSLGGPNPTLRTLDGRNITMESNINIHGVRLRKLGNLCAQYVLTNSLTDIFGRVLLLTYTMTGVNLFLFFDLPARDDTRIE